MTEIETQPLLYTAEQASVRLGTDGNGKPIVTANWLKRRAAKGLIPCTYLGRSPSWSQKDLDDLLEQRRKTPRAPGRRPR